MRLMLAALMMVMFCMSVRPARAERSLSLAEAISLQRQRNTFLQQSDLDLERTRLLLLQAKLAWTVFKVTANASATYQRNAPRPPCEAAPTECQDQNYSATGLASLTLPVWTGFANEAGLFGARHRETAARATREGTLRQLTLDLSQAYWEVRRKELERNVTAELVRDYRKLELLTEQRLKAGIAPAVDNLRARGATLGLETNLIQLRHQGESARAKLAQALEINDELVLTDEPSAYADAPPTIDEAVAKALASHPDLRVAQSVYAATNEDVRKAKGAYWPQVSLVASEQLAFQSAIPPAGLAPMPGPQFPINHLNSFFTGVKVDWTVFDTLTTWGAVRDASITRDRSRADLVQARVKVVSEVRTAYADLTQAMELQRPTHDKVLLDKNSLELLRKRYQAGAGEQIEVLDAQQKLLQSELDEVDRMVDLSEAQWRLKAAMGGY